MQDNDQIIDKIADLLTNREKYQLMLGKLSLEYRRLNGSAESLRGLAEEIKERHGLVISWKTLHNYAWVEEKLGAFEIPEDVPYRIRQALAGVEDPKEWIDKILAGASSREIFEGIKGKHPMPLIECPKCHFAFERSTYADAHKKAQEAIKDFKP
jgi:hypothetical protein